MKKVLGVLLVLCVVVGVFSGTASAATSGACGDYVTWTLSNDGTLTISGTGEMTNYSSGADVPWYSSRSVIRCVVVEKGVTSIGSYSFYGCGRLTTVTLPATLKTIGSYAFHSTAVNGIELPEGLTSLSTGAFNDCDSLTEIEFPTTLTTIGSNCFSSCDGLTSVTIPATITSVGSSAFYGCSRIAELKLLSNSKVTLGSYAFGSCSGLRTVTLPVDYDISNNPFYCTSGVTTIHYTCGASGIMTDRSNISSNVKYCQNTLEYESRGSIQSIDFEEGITHIGNFLYFGGSSSLTTVTLPSTLKTIGSYAFHSTAVNGIELPEGLTSLGTAAFDNCALLTEIEFPSTLTSIGSNCFSSCNGLTSVTIPATITSVGSHAFYGCSNLAELKLLSNSKVTLGSYAFGSCSGLRTVTLPVDYDISNNPFYRTSGVTTIHYTYGASGIMTDRTNISSNANYCQNTLEYESRNSIRSIDFEEGITHIGNFLYFGGSSSLTTVTLPSTLKTIGSYAFNGTAVNGIELPEGLTSLGTAAFDNCALLTEIEFPSTLTTIGSNCFSSCNGLTSVTIPATITSVGSHAFYGCANLAELKLLSNSKVTLGSYAFGSCSGLRTVTLPVDYDISNNPFYRTSGVTTIHYTYGASGIMTDRTNISSNANYCQNTLEYESRNSIRSIDFEEGVTYVGNYAFYFCDGLKIIVFRGNAPKFGDYVLSRASTEPYAVYYPMGNATWPVASLDKIYDIHWMGYSSSVNISSVVNSWSEGYSLILYPVDMNSFLTDLAKNDATLKNVKVSSSLGELAVSNTGCTLDMSDAIAQDIILTKDGYRDYVLPTAVSKTLINEMKAAYSLTVYMDKDRKDGKPYISTVFGRQSGSGDEYTDLRVTKLEFTDKDKVDVIITARGFGSQKVTYYIAQDQDRKISSTNGRFSGADLYDLFDDTSTVYAYAMDSNGNVTEPQKIRLCKAEEFNIVHETLSDTTMSLLGKDFLKIKIADSIPVVGGTEIDLSKFTFPVGFEKTGDEIKISVGFDLFSGTANDDGVKWKTFKELLVKDASFDREALETFCIVNKLAAGKSWKDTAKSNKFNVDVAGYIEGKITNGGFVVKEGMITVGGRFTFQYVAQGAVWVIPVYGAIEAGSDLHFGGKLTRYIPDKAFPFDATFVMTAEPRVEGKAGVGIKGAISAGLYAEGKLPIRWEFQKQHFTMDLKGEIGVEGELFILHGKKALLDGETNLINWYYGEEATAVCLQDNTKRTVSANAAEVVSRDYASTTSRWLGKKKPGAVYYANGTGALAVTDVDFQNLQTSIFSNSQPQLANMGNGMLLVWVEDDASRDTYNRMRLVYSLYNPVTAAWSEPQPVWDDGHNDGYPRMVSDGKNAWVLWQKINTTLDESNTSTIDATLENSELCLARFDAASGSFVEAQIITSNSLYEYAHSMVIADAAPVVYWAEAEENALNISGSNRLNRWMNGTVEAVAENLNYILSVEAAGDQITYVMDANGDLSTTADVTAFTISGSAANAFDNSEIGAAVTYAGYGVLDGEQILFLSDMNNIYYERDGEVKSVLTNSRMIDGNLSVVQTALGTTILWTEQVDGWNELYAVSYEKGSWTEPVQVSENGKLLSQISLISYGGKLTGVCNANAVTYDETTGQYTKGHTDLVLFKIRDFADIELGSYVSITEDGLEKGTDNEFYVTVYNNGTLPVNQITFTVTDTLGTKSVQTVAVELPSGGSEVVALNYPVPENYTTTILTITAEIEDTDADESDNRVSVTIGQQDLSVTETAVEMLDGGYLLKAVVKNESLVDAQNVTMSVCVNETDAESLHTVIIGTIHRENYALTEVMLKKDALTFDENGTAKVYLKLSSDGNESVAADNVACIVVTQAQQTVCMHPVTQTVEALAPTCTEPGYSAYEICAACGENATVREEIPAAGHSFVNGVCTACGEADPDHVALPTLTGKNFSLSFEDEILVNFYYEVSDTTDVVEQGMLVFYADPGAADIAKADDVYTGSATDGAVFMNTTDGIAAKYMGDSRYYCAYAKLTDGSYAYSKLYQYSPKKYAMNMLGKASTSEKQKALCVAMLNYGAAAQSYFGYNTDSLMNSDLTDAQKALVVAYDETLFTGAVPADSGKIANFTKTATGFSARSASVSFEGAFSINYYFTPSVAVNGEVTLYYWTPEDYAAATVLTVDNASGSSAMVAADGNYWGQVSGIAAKKLDDTYYVAGVYTDTEGNTYCTGVIAYSLSKYCMNNAKPGKSMQELASATAMYGYYANAYFS